MTNEAKQAAEWEPFKDSIKCSDGSVMFVGSHSDAVIICNAHNQQPSADFRQPDETRYPGYGSDFRAKPSAPTAEPICTKHGDWNRECGCAPTADVEKLITKDGALAYFKQFLNGDTGTASAEVLADVMLTVQHQVRTPLVAALEDWLAEANDAIAHRNKRHHLSLRDWHIKRETLCAVLALTGTGEEWQQALDQQQQTNEKILKSVTKAKEQT